MDDEIKSSLEPELESFQSPQNQPTPNEKSIEAVYDIPVQVSAVLGRTVIPVSKLLSLSRGSLVELDQRVGDPIEIYVNNQLVAKGELIVVEERLGVSLTEIVSTKKI
jgi:flagellar motor switch protein FliN/FliY